ncbi:DMT family transporter [Vibrio metschnikovii]|uniref:DMT family transporter n=1 Tax=Vibrio metschnikovii TaxID=28172 RepID=UPI00164A83BF|nr:DMT family transporter [Vibrio metschnikovii]MBC5831541.1 DMT family transporter [Vibrio metschnikovii]
MNLSMTGLLLALVAVIAGALVPLQAGSNAELGRTLGHPLWATVISLAISMAIVLPIVLNMRVALPALSEIRQLPFWVWFGGVAGVIYITSALMLVPRLGATNFIVCVIAGQLVTSLLMDHYGWMGLSIKANNPGRLVGGGLVLIGMLTVQWFTPSLPAAIK